MIRRATAGDLEEILPRTLAFNVDEGIAVDEAQLRRAIGELIASPSLGAIFLIVDGEVNVGHLVVTYGYDLEFAGRDAIITELWVDPPARGRGAAQSALALLEPHLREAEVRALHLQVRPENHGARRIYERAGFETSPRIVMTKQL